MPAPTRSDAASGASDRTADARLRSANRRTALVLGAVAIVFFVGIIATRFVDGSANGIAVMGAAVVAFLVIAIGRNLRGR
jgi:hypothetical protein